MIETDKIEVDMIETDMVEIDMIVNDTIEIDTNATDSTSTTIDMNKYIAKQRDALRGTAANKLVTVHNAFTALQKDLDDDSDDDNDTSDHDTSGQMPNWNTRSWRNRASMPKPGSSSCSNSRSSSF